MATDKSQHYRELAKKYAQQYKINPDFFVRQIERESGFNPQAYNKSGASGIAQIIPNYHPGVNVWDPDQSLNYAAKLMANHLQNYGGDWSKALAAYNWGPGNLQKHGLQNAPLETRNYIQYITGGQFQGAKGERLLAKADQRTQIQNQVMAKQAQMMQAQQAQAQEQAQQAQQLEVAKSTAQFMLDANKQHLDLAKTASDNQIKQQQASQKSEDSVKKDAVAQGKDPVQAILDFRNEQEQPTQVANAETSPLPGMPGGSFPGMPGGSFPGMPESDSEVNNRNSNYQQSTQALSKAGKDALDNIQAIAAKLGLQKKADAQKAMQMAVGMLSSTSVKDISAPGVSVSHSTAMGTPNIGGQVDLTAGIRRKA